jgi:hypothetical protein
MFSSHLQITGRKPSESASLKADGTRILTCAPQGASGKNVTILDDKMTLVVEFPQGDNLANIRAAIAVPTFDKFIILSDNGQGAAQLCLVDVDGKTIKKSPFMSNFQADALVPSLTQASMTADGKYFALTHIAAGSSNVSMLRVFDVETLTELSNRPLMAKVGAPQSFILNTAGGMWSGTTKKFYYWAINATLTDPNRGNVSQLEFYRLDSTADLVQPKTSVVAEWKLQRVVERSSLTNMRFMIVVNDNKALFACSMSQPGANKEQISIFEYTPSADCKEGNVTTLLTEDHDMETVRLVLSPDAKYLFYSQKLPDNHSNFAWSILKINRETTKIKLSPLTMTKLSKGIATTVAFSQDAKTLLVGCNTLNLFKLNLTA